MPVYQSTLETIRNNVLAKLRLEASQDSDFVDEWINQTYVEVAQQTGFLQQAGTANLTAGVDSYSLPAEIAQLKNIVIAYGNGQISEPLMGVTLEQILELRQQNTAAGSHVSCPYYALVGQNQLEIWPEPTGSWTIQFWYSYLPDALDTDDSEPLIQEPYGSQILEAGALVKAAQFKKDALISDYEQLYAVWMSRFQAWLNRREGYNRSFEMQYDDFVTNPSTSTFFNERDR